MTANWAVGVCGFGRCGSTMTMAMLVAGGCPPGGHQHPPYEGFVEQVWNRDLTGTAFKLLDTVLQTGTVPPGTPHWRFVWLDRDPVQQARSHLKFARLMQLPIPVSERNEARLVAGYRPARSRALGVLHGHGPVLKLRYEEVLSDPRRAAEQLRTVWPALDIDAAAAAVHQRSPECLPGVDFELSTVAP